MKDLIWIEVSKKAIADNFKQIKKTAGKNTKIAVAVKANAYGHGLKETSKIIAQAGADWLCVNSIEEAEALRASGIKMPVLIMGFTQKADANRVAKSGAGVFAYNLAAVKVLSAAAVRVRKKIPVFIKIDTGLSRLGLLPEDTMSFIGEVRKLKGVKIEGVATHFAVDDDGSHNGYFKKQLTTFRKIAAEIKDEGLENLIISGSSSATAIIFPEHGFDIIRTGIGVYGYHSSEHVGSCSKKKGINLEPALTLKTKIAQIKEIPKGVCVSYGCDFTARKKMKIAVLPIGYSDGLDRKLGNKGYVLIKGKKAPIIGRVCMNMMIVDVSNIFDVKTEDETVIIGKQGRERVTADDHARWADTINYEIMAKLRESISRYYI
ncbi:MAG: alanine racemase [Candidatus Terrybacteria bacterium CG10_big_fil_rev_8_21_14_0_10_41_10]|uniref:Alanine racemase n=1 Tax=Candidatus Terrybacteria bacterium CG10_big_fil_rev_8_21_14_0_10_41_10 TaxID=1975026 RepID=A0A2M8LBH5_9BACT|nr:MAG: alanine racemase [Candidatus Terrybacteria bacterium CG10_big_fil_rev_8_21_14_0_10_41_10]